MGRREACVAAGVLAGLTGVAVFLALHHVLIVPIWPIAPMGALLAALAGAAVGAAYGELLPHLPPRPWTTLAVVGVIGAILAPPMIVAELWGPMFSMDGSGGGALLVSGSEVAVRIVVGLLGVATVAGAAVGWWIARSRRGAATSAGAALLLAIGPGHNIPLLGGTPAVRTEVVILAAVIGASSLTLVASAAWLERRTLLELD